MSVTNVCDVFLSVCGKLMLFSSYSFVLFILPHIKFQLLIQNTVITTHLHHRETNSVHKKYFIYDIDPVYKQAAIRYENWKLIIGTPAIREFL